MKADLMSLQDARNNYAQGNEFITTSCLKCRFSPSYIDAIPLFKNAGEKFHGVAKYDEEICCRKKLTECFRATKSYWEEGNEYDKMAQVQLKQLNKPEEAFTSICNAHNAFVAAKEYESSIKSLSKIASEFFEVSQADYAERILKIIYDCALKYFHVLLFNNDENTSHSYLYEALDKYIDVLYFNKKHDEATENIENLLKLMENEEPDKSKLLRYYGIMMIGFIILKRPNEYEDNAKIAREMKSSGVEDYGVIKIIDSLNEGIKNAMDDTTLNAKIADLCREYPVNIGKLLKAKLKEMIVKEGSIDTNADEPFDLK